jgi:TatD DNase family protein
VTNSNHDAERDDNSPGSPATFVDTHIHLDDDAFVGDREDVVERAKLLGVEQMVNIAYRPSRWASSALLKETYPMISVAAGLHPGLSDEFSQSAVTELEAAIGRIGAIAVGEIGFDFFRPGYDLALQERSFRAQIELAKTLRLPIVIHQRSAEDDCVRVLRESAADLAVVLHSFDGSWSLGRLGIDRGYYFGVGGLMTRGAAHQVREVLAKVPADRLVLETDAPYLTPNGIKIKRNEPANIPYIAQRLAELREVSVAEIARATTENARRVFNLPARPPTTAESGTT